ncbi:prion-inhibition and propagation-domain-containing protein [Xylariaceae sp. FL1019]|nr:prion-inhibition and propagation-domain-containing protein [Xylariaceae sp. FL1019]
MAEAVGTVARVVTLIGLLKGCIDACELIRAAKKHKIELERCDMKLAVEQCRLKTWGTSMGLMRDKDSQQGRHLLEQFEFQHVVEDALRQIISLLTNTHRLSKKYGAQPVSREMALPFYSRRDFWRSSSAFQLTLAFRQLRVHEVPRDRTTEMIRSSVWVLYDQKEYSLLIEELRTLVDAVENVTRDLVTQEQQQQFFASRIKAISDVRTLNMLTEVCELDYPAFSYAASARAEVLCFTRTYKADSSVRYVWYHLRDGAKDDSNRAQEEFSDDIEDEMANWSLADFRRHYLALLNVQAAKSRTTTHAEQASPGQTDQAVTTFTAATDDTSSQRLFTEDDLKRGGVAEFDRAIVYIDEIMQRFNRRPEVFKYFLQTLQTYQRGQISIKDVHAKIVDLFRSENDLVEDFKFFLPENRVQRTQPPSKQDIEESTAGLSSVIRALGSPFITDSDDRHIPVSETPPQEHKNPGPNLKNASKYVNLVNLRLKDTPSVFRHFLNTLKDWQSRTIDFPGVVRRIETLLWLSGHEDLLREFGTFLPPGYGNLHRP